MLLHSLLFTLALFSVTAHAAIRSWSFKNWNGYEKNETAWREAWGIESSGWAWPRKSNPTKNHKITKDPAGSGVSVLRVDYPAKSSNPAGKIQGGIGFYGAPIELPRNPRYIVLEYQVYFPSNFTFVKGGKLPGLYGGHTACSGGADSSTCFSTRFMWRTKGQGEIYAYLPETEQRKSLCNEEGNFCNPSYGYSLGRGTFTFPTGKWVTLRQTVRLNKSGSKNGLLRIHVNGKKVYTENKLVFTTKNTDKLIGIAFHTFFGGNGPSWAPKKAQHTYFKNFKLTAYSL
ncbi:hypothetical protein BX666DRAFT_1893932 [Dichotomocladium elegans]|nr:hypothetical protein BX666DRAFT_1893932 [Dichotomocladium elegans]